MSLPIINVKINNTIYAFPEDGDLIYKYKPLQNLKPEIVIDGNIDLVDLSLSSSQANININHPISLDTEVSYDSSVNLIINDYTNPLKIVNSRFYLIDSDSYKISDRKGNIDTNIYTPKDFKIETGLIKAIRTVVTLDFKGIESGGNMPVGSYHFYFKLADADGNESDFVAESGKVLCHIGSINQPSSIRGGQEDEISDKLIKFQINNLDLAYDYINIYYTRHSGSELLDQLKTYRITDKFKIRGNSTELSITGFENHLEVDNSEINMQYTNFDAVQTNANCQNITFTGNVTKNYELFKTLEKYSLFITPQLSEDTVGIGNLNSSFIENNNDIGFEYYNTKNIYYKLGLWDEDIYRFGIVYILPDYTLSPVFNIRGKKELGTDDVFYPYSGRDAELNAGEDYILEATSKLSNPENIKGVFKIKADKIDIFNAESSIKPIGIKFNFQNDILSLDPITGLPGLMDITRGFFIVRQKRIPTLLTQAVSIATTKNSFTPIIFGTNTLSDGKTSREYFAESFLKFNKNHPVLGRNLFKVDEVVNNALICPEACLKTAVFNNFFNSSEFTLKKFNYSTSTPWFNDDTGTRHIFSLNGLKRDINSTNNTNLINSNLLLVEPGIDLINNGSTNKFSSRAGAPEEAWKHSDPELGNINNLLELAPPVGKTDDELAEMWSNGVTKIRGDFNTYIGSSASNLEFGQHYNIFQKGYDFSNNWKNYFRIRYNDSSPFMAVSDRIEWNKLKYKQDDSKIIYYTDPQYRGDCYINTYAHRVNWNFIDPELPTNKKIVDPYTWYKNYKVRVTKHQILTDKLAGMVTSQSDLDGKPTTDTVDTISYKKVLPLFTYGGVDISANGSVTLEWMCLPDGKKFKKYSEANGLFGTDKINRPDINAVPIGHWVTFKICSNINLAMRDTDFSRPLEEAVHKMKRSFYPLQDANPINILPESTVINSGISNALSDKYYFEIPDVPFIKTNFSNRIHYSELLQDNSFKNGNRIFKLQNYQDYTQEYGALVKLVEWYGTLIAIMEHGILMIPVNERAMMTNAAGEDVYINTANVLPANPKVLSNTFGSVWSDSIIKTSKFIYGIDTIGKKIWRTNGQTFEVISDMKIQKFLNDNISLKNIDRLKTPGIYSIKTHYNAFKQDIMFVFVYGEQKWHLCWNELLNNWSTRYSWFPEFSENINNIFYTFANEKVHPKGTNKLYKHGFAGSLDEITEIKHTKWYEDQEQFELEFVVADIPGVQKIFDNLKIISNKSEPKSFDYEVVGEGYDWHMFKEIICWINNSDAFGTKFIEDKFNFILNADGSYTIDPATSNAGLVKIMAGYQYILSNTLGNILTIHPDFPLPNWIPSEKIASYKFAKLPFILKDRTPSPLSNVNWENYKSQTVLINDPWNGEERVLSGQDGKSFVKYGRTKGNMAYVEDSWDIQIQPIKIRYAYLKGGSVKFSKISEMRIRDKYIKIRVRYDGTKHTIINALKTFFTISYA